MNPNRRMFIIWSPKPVTPLPKTHKPLERSVKNSLKPAEYMRVKANMRFGSMDPAHVEEVEDAMCDSGSSSDGGALGFEFYETQ